MRNYTFNKLPLAFVWMPRYWDKKALVDKRLVKEGMNTIVFTCDSNYNKVYCYDGSKVIQNAEVCSNGVIDCYAIPLEDISEYADIPASMAAVIAEQQKDYNQYKAARRNKQW